MSTLTLVASCLVLLLLKSVNNFMKFEMRYIGDKLSNIIDFLKKFSCFNWFAATVFG